MIHQPKDKSPMQKIEMEGVKIELSDAKKTVRDLAFKIEEANLRSKESQRTPKWCQQEDPETSVKNEDDRYKEVMKEIENMKQELGKLKLDMARVLKEKRHAERASKASTSKKSTLLASIELMKKEMQELSEEQAMVEFARIEAVNECESIETRRKEDADRYKAQLWEIQTNVEDNKLQLITVSDVNSLKQEDGSPLNTITDELNNAKQELASIKGEGFKFMTSMDVIRNELNHVREEKARLQKTEQKQDITVQNLNSKILRAKAKLESLTSTETKTDTVASNLVITLEQLRAEAEAAKKEEELVNEEIETMKGEIHKIEYEIELAEERLEAAMEELKETKSLESKALMNLRNLIKSTVEARDMASVNSSMITITDFEYEYLTRKAGGAADLADKKIAAAQAWVEALKANEREIMMKIEIAQREIDELSIEVDPDADADVNADAEGEGLEEKVVASPRRSMYRVKASVKRARLQKFRSPAARYSGKLGSARREKAAPKFSKFMQEGVI